MGWWTDVATPHKPSPNGGGTMREHRGVVIHIAQGTYLGTISWQMNPSSNVSSHFVVARDGRITQMLDTNTVAWTQRDGNGRWLSIENEGYVPGALTDAQVTANAKILAKSAQVYGHPIRVATSPKQQGLGHHSMGVESGFDWGHPACPGRNIIAQKPEIVARAKGGGQEEDDVSASEVWAWDVDPSGGTYTASGSLWTTFSRTGFLANEWAPATSATLAAMAQNVTDIENALANTRTKVSTMQHSLTEVSSSVASQAQKLDHVSEDVASQSQKVSEVSAEMGAQTQLIGSHARSLDELKWLIVLILIIAVAGGASAITWAALAGK